MSTSGSKSNEHVAHFLVDIHNKLRETERANEILKEALGFFAVGRKK